MPAIPVLPDSERLTEYTVASASTGPFTVGFDIYADGDDPENWIEVWLDDEIQDGNWTLTSDSGDDLSILARPLTDAEITFDEEISGALKIVGARRPRRTSQFTEGGGIPARSHNQVLTDIVATLREHSDKFGRTVVAPAGETLGVLPSAADRASKFAVYDADGNPTVADDTLPVGVAAVASAIANDSEAEGDTVADVLTALAHLLIPPTTVTTAGDVTVTTETYIRLNKTVPAATTINLPAASSRNGVDLEIKDVAGNAATYNYTIVADGSETMDGDASLVGGMNYQVTRLRPRAGGWDVLHHG